MSESVDDRDLKSLACMSVRVRVPLSALTASAQAPTTTKRGAPQKGAKMDCIVKVETYGNVTVLIQPDNPEFDWYARQINCEWIEIVRPKGFDFVMIVDEEGLLNERDLNPVGSYIYGTMIHGQPIAGDILICKEEYGNLLPLSEDEAEALAEKLRRGYKEILDLEAWR